MKTKKGSIHPASPIFALSFKTLLHCFSVFFACGALISCSDSDEQSDSHPPTEVTTPLISESLRDQIQGHQESQTILVTGLSDPDELLTQAKEKGLKVDGRAVIQIEGPADKVTELRINSSEDPQVILDSPFTIERPAETEQPVSELLYLASEDFGIPAYRKKNPLIDGRDTVIGIIDDGVSLFHSGLSTTSDGKRKIKSFRSASPELNVILTDEDLVTLRPSFLTSNPESRARYTKVWFGDLSEPNLLLDATQAAQKQILFADWNENGIRDRYSVAVGSLRDRGYEICIDLNVNQTQDENECVRDFFESGEFIFWAKGSSRNLAGIFDPETATLTLVEGEQAGDGHGEGVASVAAGHRIGGEFNGVAPGAQIIDYDISSRSGQTESAIYSIGTFLRALEWVGKSGADVANISYSLFFQSVAGQLFMEKALATIVQEYNLVLSMSAGNNGPGLSSLNRRAIYPDDVLVAGAFVGPKLYESVHGVTGLPSQGRVISYSSRGPGPFGGLGPTVISPLSSLTHAPPGEGYRAFGGTSSASPALAGLAANLISAIKQENIPVHADLVVHAIRLSGKPLENLPYLEQGHGIPKIATAIKLYKDLLDKSLPTRIDVRFPTGPVADVDPNSPSGLSRDPRKQARGLFLKLSGLAGKKEISFEASLTGLFGPKSINQDDPTQEILTPLELDSNTEWISAPANSFVSRGQSRITLTLDLVKALEAMGSESEIFGELHLLDMKTAHRLATIPVTIINDQALNASRQETAVLRTEQSKRIHVYVQPGTQALSLTPKILSGTGDNLQVTVFDPRGVQINNRFRRPEGTTHVPVIRSGWHQIVLTKYRGGRESLKASISIKPVMLTTSSATLEPVLSKQNGEFVIQNDHPSEQWSGALELRATRQSIKREIQDLSPSGSARFEFSLRGFERDVELNVRNLSQSAWNFFENGHSCVWDLRDASDTQLAQIFGSSGTIIDLSSFEKMQNPAGEIPSDTVGEGFEHLVRQVSVRCWIFEDTGTETLQDTRLSFDARASLHKDPILEFWSVNAGTIPVRMRTGLNTLQLPDMLRKHLESSKHQSLELRLRSLDEGPNEGIQLGEFVLQ